MPHKSAAEFNQILADAKTKVKVGGTYYHYKHSDQFYTVIDIVIIEVTHEPAVIYRAEYEDYKGVTFMRPISEFIAEVEVNGERKSRFTLVE